MANSANSIPNLVLLFVLAALTGWFLQNMSTYKAKNLPLLSNPAFFLGQFIN